FDIYASGASDNGTALHTNGILISSAGGDQLSPAMVANGDFALIIWRDKRNGIDSDEIFGARLDVKASPVLLDPNGIAISTYSAMKLHPAVAGDGTDFFVVWE